jgi:hypothetical protein
MARVPRAKAEPEAPKGAWHTGRQVVAAVLFAAAAACLLYGAWLGLMMHFTKSMPAWAIGRVLICAVLASALYTICVRIEPLPPHRKRRGNRWINVETPTLKQIWETGPGDFVEAIFMAIGMMTAPVLAFISFGYVMLSSDFPDFIIAVVIGGGAFALEGVFVNWRGRGMFDPPGQVRKAPVEAEPKPKPEKTNDREIYVHDDD